MLFAGLSLALEPSDTLHLQGYNGVGKSSLLRMIAGFLPPAAGTIITATDGVAVSANTVVALLEENAALKASETLEESFDHWRDLSGGVISRQQCLEAAEILGIQSLLAIETGRFSTGQRKRAALCRILLSTKPIWLLDEPFNGLDKKACSILISLIKNHCKAGGAVIFAAHDDAKAASCASIRLNIGDYSADRLSGSTSGHDSANDLSRLLEENW